MSVLIQPLITEKLTRIQEEHQQYAFEVSSSATKPEIKKAIEKRYPEVKVARVNTMIVPSKPKGRFTKGGLLTVAAGFGKKPL
jgi:large subunit ribosomal protein L23